MRWLVEKGYVSSKKFPASSLMPKLPFMCNNPKDQAILHLIFPPLQFTNTTKFSNGQPMLSVIRRIHVFGLVISFWFLLVIHQKRSGAFKRWPP